jgi:curved DNA-binding protein CbpA
MGNSPSSENNISQEEIQGYIQQQQEIIFQQQQQINHLSQQQNQRMNPPRETNRFTHNIEPSLLQQKKKKKKIDPYKILMIDKNYTEDILKKQYLKKAYETHPDRGGDQDEFNNVAISYQVLLKKLNESRDNHDHYELKNNTDEFINHQSRDPRRNNQLSSNFNSDRFNKMYEENRIKNPYDDGYKEWMNKNTGTSENSINLSSSQFTNDKFNEVFSNIKQKNYKTTELVQHVPEENISCSMKDSLVTLGQGRIKNFSGQTPTGLSYRDYKDAYTNNFLIDENMVQNKGGQNSLQEVERDRENISYTMNDTDRGYYDRLRKMEEKKEQERVQRLQRHDQHSGEIFQKLNSRMLQ